MDSRTPTTIALPNYIPQFDGLRAIAIMAVFVAHSEFLRALPHAQFLEFGRIGVDLFFVLSGFLITGILLDSRKSSHYFRNFYMRRAIRIWPLYYVILVLAIIGIPFVFEGTRGFPQWPYFIFYIQNLSLHPNIPAALAPTWSLAVEEQFYMTWPLIVFFASERTLRNLLLTAIGFSLIFRIVAFEQHASLEFIHIFTLSRLDPIAFGCLAALLLRSPRCTRDSWHRWSIIAVCSGIAGLALSRLFWKNQTTVIGYVFLGLSFTGLLGIALLIDPKKSTLGRLLVNEWLRYIGRISYGLYLIHMPLFLGWQFLVQRRNLPFKDSIAGNLFSALVQFGLAFLFAALSWHLFESKLLRLKRYFPSHSEIQKTENEINLNTEKLLHRGRIKLLEGSVHFP